ncbi:UDP-N-acetylmuramoyl-L-alanine--D-glutamate ligase [Sporosarcina thermotolerans]|uniref:UDP-N-acetylmuramoylalanine--D-glutamate ligase n=1 Tax=Sporosarcina thermotolerans TaxID=633404 RepID=A0AAW9A9L5_9BACL|nr:UDP-N-acetylmuramoyl-L-alanine--D-glutamate ligase [Sporosarcina thermotolerans]MDW0115818.1 UDP-N-acetylmuramoyl-L-alanine--D-glutamate ligase [Sporosarcina thermotolerans]WHT46947.1 UDP-N-acetylmuramoyl-L-alanine--D-glutamate ligase [Sporosarcina thermotolerans]
MENRIQFKGKKVLVLGLAKSGYAAADLLHSLGAEVLVNDSSPEEGNNEALALQSKGINVICGGHPKGILDGGFDFIVKNPGIPYKNQVLQQALKKEIPIWTEIELAYLISKAPIIAITGSNGKTTTTTLLYHILNIGGKKPLIAGNIGTVACTVAEEATEEEVIAMEVSSFQLAGTEKFRPRISVWTNLYEAHIDYHGTTEEYAMAKAKVTRNQTKDDFFIYNADQPELLPYVERSAATKIPFTLKGRAVEGISADEEMIYWLGEPFLERSIIKLLGQHNLENILAATASAILMDCDKETIENVLSSFTGVRHRMQFVKELKGRAFYNDSKATNTLATKSALSSFQAPVILLAGGLDRGHSFEELRPYMGRVKALFALGETGDRLIEFAKSCGVPYAEKVETMDDAVNGAFQISLEGDQIVLSPACASWDQYPNFEKRGDAFIDAIDKL